MTDSMPVWMRVKPATARASDDAGGDKVLAAVSSRINHSARFSEYASFEHPNRVVPLDAAIEVDRFALNQGKPPRHGNLFAEELGMLLVPRPQGDLNDCDMAALCKISTESAEAIAAFAAARADGVTTPDEAAMVRQKIADAQVAFAELDERLRLIEVAK
ncbi:MAG TPA: phage regulatory CII family protein [Devosia sp.]|nr:phage regulatory CII family protein [Devosia sp.]